MHKACAHISLEVVSLIVVLHEEGDDFLGCCKFYQEIVNYAPAVVAHGMRFKVSVDKIVTYVAMKNS